MKIFQYVFENVVSYSGTEENGKNYRLLNYIVRAFFNQLT